MKNSEKVIAQDVCKYVRQLNNMVEKIKSTEELEEELEVAREKDLLLIENLIFGLEMIRRAAVREWSPYIENPAHISIINRAANVINNYYSGLELETAPQAAHNTEELLSNNDQDNGAGLVVVSKPTGWFSSFFSVFCCACIYLAQQNLDMAGKNIEHYDHH